MKHFDRITPNAGELLAALRLADVIIASLATIPANRLIIEAVSLRSNPVEFIHDITQRLEIYATEEN